MHVNVLCFLLTRLHILVTYSYTFHYYKFSIYNIKMQSLTTRAQNKSLYSFSASLVCAYAISFADFSHSSLEKSLKNRYFNQSK